MTRTIVTTAVLALLALPLAAQDFRSVNKLDVEDTGNGTFIVHGPAEQWARGYWCAAADYGRRKLGLSQSAVLLVTRPYGSADKAVHFGVAQPGTTVEPVLSLAKTLHTQGSGLKIGQAQSFCADRNLGRGS